MLSRGKFKSCQQDGGYEWCCPDCGVDVMFGRHAATCQYKSGVFKQAVQDESLKQFIQWRREETMRMVNEGRDYGDETEAQFPRSEKETWDYTAFPGAEDGPPQRIENAKPGPIEARMVGIGGAPTRATTLPEGAELRKQFPVASGVLDYFPDAIAAVSNVSWRGNNQHNPGQPLHWARSKSGDEADTMQRHFLQRGTLDTDGVRHSAKMAWRALALLQKEIEQEGKDAPAQPALTYTYKGYPISRERWERLTGGPAVDPNRGGGGNGLDARVSDGAQEGSVDQRGVEAVQAGSPSNRREPSKAKSLVTVFGMRRTRPFRS